MTTDMVKEWVHSYPGDLEQGHPCVQSSEEILSNLEERIDALHQCADVVYGHWIKGLIDR